jgi:antitoxin component YwqK of YwqJK toxin-antitoxin module
MQRVTLKNGEYCVFESMGDGNLFGRHYEKNGTLLYKGEMEGTHHHPDGFGTSFFPNGQVEYEGQWILFSPTLPSAKHGMGTLYDASGDKVYQGTWHHNLRHGHGVSTEHGVLYIGSWVSGQRDGRGAEYTLDEELLFDGEWKADRRHGHGKIYGTEGLAYEGTLVEDVLKHGQEYIVSTGCVEPVMIYEGDFKGGFVRHGHGRTFYTVEDLEDRWFTTTSRWRWNGAVVCYEGGWVEGLRHGEGVLKDIDGTILYKGSYHKGEKRGKKRNRSRVPPPSPVTLTPVEDAAALVHTKYNDAKRHATYNISSGMATTRCTA